MKVNSCGRNCIWVEIATALRISVSRCTRAVAPVAESPIASAIIRMLEQISFSSFNRTLRDARRKKPAPLATAIRDCATARRPRCKSRCRTAGYGRCAASSARSACESTSLARRSCQPSRARSTGLPSIAKPITASSVQPFNDVRVNHRRRASAILPLSPVASRR